MKKHLLLLLLFISAILNAQEVKQVKERLKEGKETYYVLKSDLKTKHGTYIVKHYKTRKIIVEGVFNNGQKEGKWSEFRKTGVLKSCN